MKPALLFFLLIFAFCAPAQTRIFNAAEIDAQVSEIKAMPARELANRLTSRYSTDREKVRAIFTWIVRNVSYRVKRHYKSPRTAQAEATVLDKIDSCRCKSANEIVAESVIITQTAVCEGYAKLFKTLCDYSGIRSTIITGFGRTNVARFDQRFRSNHSWNAVFLEGRWQLMDLTWASGYISYFGDEFISHINENYYLAEPSRFADDHIPDDLRWTLMPQPPVSRDYQSNAFRQKPFVKYNIMAFKPSKGMIEAAVGDTINFVMEIPELDDKKKIAADTLSAEAALLPVGIGHTFLEPSVKGKTVFYQYRVTNTDSQWILLLYNNEPVLRYRLMVQPTSTSKVYTENIRGF